MKYIPGFEFIVPTAPQLQGGSILQQQTSFKRHDEQFQKGKAYTLLNIRKREEGLAYIFTADSQQFELVFLTSAQADQRIDSVLGVL